MLINYLQTEKELKKRWQFEYNWRRKQNNAFDKRTNFIYKIKTFEDLLLRIENEFKAENDFEDLKNYALNRWYNFTSAKAVESIFKENKDVKGAKNSRDSEKDFFINDIPFDHKTSIFPKGFKQNLSFAINHKKELIKWFYENQSQQQRHHLKNRLFVVLYESNKKEHWKLKAEIGLIKSAVENYLQNFDKANLQVLSFDGENCFADVVFVVK